VLFIFLYIFEPRQRDTPILPIILILLIMKMKFGAIVVAGSGKIGGHVASKNRSGAYLRTKTTPSNPNTSYQSAARGILGSLSQGWSALTDEQRLSWNNAVKDFASTDIFGDIKNPSGFNLYVKLNSNLLNAGEAIISVAPAKAEIPFGSLTAANMVVATGALTLELDGADINGANVFIYATPALSAGTSYAKNRFRLLGVAVVATGEAVLTGDYATRFGAFSLGQNIQVGYRVVADNGQVSPMQTITATITA
jgi:hypothetical protein